MAVSKFSAKNSKNVQQKLKERFIHVFFDGYFRDFNNSIKVRPDGHHVHLSCLKHCDYDDNIILIEISESLNFYWISVKLGEIPNEIWRKSGWAKKMWCKTLCQKNKQIFSASAFMLFIDFPCCQNTFFINVT